MGAALVLVVGAPLSSAVTAPAETQVVAASTTAASTVTATVVRRTSAVVATRWTVRGRGSRPTSSARYLVTVSTRVTSSARAASVEVDTPAVRSASDMRSSSPRSYVGGAW